MWCVIECSGVICAFLTYVIVLAVQCGFVRVGIWEGLLAGDLSAYLHLAFFQTTCALIFWSHLKCMTTEPGLLPKEYEELDCAKMAPELQQAVTQIQQELDEADAQGEFEEDNVKKEEEEARPVDFKQSLEEVERRIDINIQVLKKQREKEIKKHRHSLMKNLLKKFINVRQPDPEEIELVSSSSKKQKSETSDDKFTTDGKIDSRKLKPIADMLAKKCKKCNSVKPPMSHHCSICGRCVARMDHHCPWVNNCVGFNNQKHFLLFLVYVFIGSFHALILMCINGIYCMDKNCYLFADMGVVALTILALFCAILFGIFVCIMFVDQIQCIIANTSTIDELKLKGGMASANDLDLKGDKAKGRTWWQNIKEVFGSDPDIYWMLPTDVPRELIVEREYD